MESIFSGIQATGVFIIVLSVLIVVHEWGHFITAKKLGVKVDEFSLGFGPTLYSKIHNGTNYLVKAIPLGGYVKMAGDERSQCTGKADEFFSKSVGARSLIVLNGPVVNFVLAYFCFVWVFMLGFPDLSNKVGELMNDYPAYEAGLQVDDRIIAVDGVDIEGWTDLQKNIAGSTGETITFELLRDGGELTKTITPRIERRTNLFGQKIETRLIGIRPATDIIGLKYGFFESTVKAYEKLYEITAMTYKSLFYIVTGSMSAKESVTGPIGIFYIIKSAAEMGFAHLLFIVGVISASLAIFNLLPVIPLDGGHLFLLAIEKVRGKALPPKVDDFIIRLGFSMIIFLALFVFYSDFVRFGWVDKFQQIWP